VIWHKYCHNANVYVGIHLPNKLFISTWKRLNVRLNVRFKLDALAFVFQYPQLPSLESAMHVGDLHKIMMKLVRVYWNLKYFSESWMPWSPSVVIDTWEAKGIGSLSTGGLDSPAHVARMNLLNILHVYYSSSLSVLISYIVTFFNSMNHLIQWC
jgi:hypothetical protein